MQQPKVRYSEVIHKRADGRWRLTITLEEEATTPASAPSPGGDGRYAELREMPRLTLNVREVAELLGLSRSTVYLLVASGELPSVAIGRKRLVRREALERFLIDHEVAP